MECTSSLLLPRSRGFSMEEPGQHHAEATQPHRPQRSPISVLLPFAALFLLPAVAPASPPETVHSGARELRLERAPVEGGAELLTVFARGEDSELPLMSVLRDTLGDADPDN